MPKKKNPNELEANRSPLRSLPGRQNIYTYYKSRSYREDSPTRQTFDTLSEHQVVQPKIQNQNHIQRKVKATIVFAILVGLLIYDLLLSSTVSITTIGATRITGIYMHPLQAYKQTADELLSKSISSRTKLTINTTKIDSEMLQAYPELSNVSVQVPLIGGKLAVAITPVYPALILNDQTNQHFLIGPTGNTLRAITSNYISDFAVPVVNDQTALLAQIGKQVLAQSDTNFIQNVSDQLKVHGLKIQSMSLPAASRELDVYLTGQPYFIKFDLADPGTADIQIGTFLATRNYLVKNQIVPSQYVDARVPGRVFYK